ncbi:hypothetical protein [Chrysodeixis includens nucleopolyhedrovirus]|uniref:Uncharacterized protein n=1 Tax=Chrysodeixis includens nucleopolyhedrovirus TaxID=1207438 RepID=A0A5B8YR48_9ABAC|nr:hypothetical protein QKU06_gp039 [Chrysodeixis includens nucleopolyhedrovirus]QED40567.1 hypothetical protein [Chrysodeixis includens nucleopolyhedrovirus]
MISTTSESNEGPDIFDREKIKLLTYDEYNQLKRYAFSKHLNGQYCYIDKYTNKEVCYSYPIATVDDFNNYLLLVF